VKHSALDSEEGGDTFLLNFIRPVYFGSAVVSNNTGDIMKDCVDNRLFQNKYRTSSGTIFLMNVQRLLAAEILDICVKNSMV
jgi:hypothetical protein